MSAIINFSLVNKTYSGRTGLIPALQDLSFSVPAQQIYGLAGVNGAGKTTAIKTLLGLCQPDSGQVTLLGKPPESLTPAEIGFAPEIPDLPDYLTVAETIDYSCSLIGYDLQEERLNELLTLLELDSCSQRLNCNLSKGNLQRLSLAAAIAHEPDLVVLDEPTSGLDPLGRKLVKKIMLQLKEAGKTVFFSTHVLSDLREICDGIGIIDQGRMVFTGRSHEFCRQNDSASLEKRFSELIRGQAAREAKK